MSNTIQPGYGTRTYSAPTKTRETKQASGESKTGTEVQTRRTASDELSYLSEKYECLKSPGYSVKINSSLLAKAASDEKTSEWLEYNLSLIPNVVDNLKSTAAARGSKVISCNISINGYDSMTTEMVTQSEADPGTEEMQKESEEKIQKKREEKRAQEKQKAKKAGLCTHRRTALLRFPPAASSCLSPLRRKRKRHLALWPGAFSCAWRVYPSGLSCCASGAGPFSASSGSIKSSMWHSRAWATL